MKFSKEVQIKIKKWHDKNGVSFGYEHTLKVFECDCHIQPRTKLGQREKKLTTKNIRHLKLALDTIGHDEIVMLSRAEIFTGAENLAQQKSVRYIEPTSIALLGVLWDLKKRCEDYEKMHSDIYSSRHPNIYFPLANTVASHMYRELGLTPTMPATGAFGSLLHIVLNAVDPDFWKDKDSRAIREPASKKIKAMIDAGTVTFRRKAP